MNMITLKKSAYSKKEILLAKYAKAFGHPARIAIIQLLLKKRACVCGDLVDELPIAQSTVSQHLKELKEAGLIKGEIEGTSICYCIDEKGWTAAQKALTDFLNTSLADMKNCC
jgi:DNA-binding transcriptional ArsR family regulator